MKNKFLVPIVIFVFLSMYNCQQPFIDVNPISAVNEVDTIVIIGQDTIVIPDVIVSEEAVDGPQQTGVACGNFSEKYMLTELIAIIEIPDSLPETYDLSDKMPPVRSQGNQGSCVSWATTYYLKSYQEKIQYNYDYVSYETVMSPAFVYNQTKANDNCLSGSAIGDALEVLKTQGVSTWRVFPYSDAHCSEIPSDSLLLADASKNKIKEYFRVGIPDTIVPVNYTLKNLIKTLVSEKQPVVISMDFENLNFENQTISESSNPTDLTEESIDEDIYIANTYSENPVPDTCGHAILIVGYNDAYNAFKIVNSWGTSWGNEGYAWVHYNFFLEEDDVDFEQGLTSAYVAYDEED